MSFVDEFYGFVSGLFPSVPPIVIYAVILLLAVAVVRIAVHALLRTTRSATRAYLAFTVFGAGSLGLGAAWSTMARLISFG